MPAKNSVKTYAEDSFYHVYNRGVNKDPIFKDQLDYSVFLRYLKTYLLPRNDQKLTAMLGNPQASAIEKDRALRDLGLKNFNGRIELIAYCLMPNHLHFLVHQTRERDIKSFMQALMTRYTMYFNKRHGRVGPLFQGKYKAVLVASDEQLLYLTRYIHRNPLDLKNDRKRSDLIRSDLFSQPSSYGVYLRTQKQDWVKPDAVLIFFSKKNEGFNSYQSFVEGDDMDHENRASALISKESIDMDLI